MAINCRYLSIEPYINDVYKTPENRHVCRNEERNKDFKFFSDRFVAEDICDTCPFRDNIPE